MDRVKHSSVEIESELYARYPKLEVCRDQIRKAFGILSDMHDQGGMLYIAGNGGSAADSLHIAGELVKSFRFKRVLSDADRERLETMKKASRSIAPVDATDIIYNTVVKTYR